MLRKPEPFEALAWAVIEQLIDTQAAGNIAWAFTRRHGDAAPERRRGPPRRREAFANQAALEAAGLAPTQARTLARVARRWRRQIDPGATDQRGSTRSPASASGRSRTWTCSAAAATTSRWPRTSACATPTRAIAGVRTGSVTEAEFEAVLDRYAPLQGLAAMYLVAAGWRSGARWSQSPHALRRR